MQAKDGPIISLAFAISVVFVLLASSTIAISSQCLPGGTGGKALPPTPPPTRSSTSVADYEVEYALITTQALAPTFEPLVEWKLQKGLKAKLYTTDGDNGIFAKYPNGDDQKRIHDFLHDLDGNSAGLQWVCIGGDNEVIPSRALYTGAAQKYGSTSTSEWQDYYGSDYYYAGLGSSWDTDGDGIYGEIGEEDTSAEVYVGRLPAKDAAEAATMVGRIIGYERDIAAGDWLGRGLFGASLMDAPNVLDNPATVNVDEGYNDYKDNAFKCIQKTLPNVPSSLTRTELYDYPRIDGGHYTTANDTLDQATFKAELNKGYGIVDYVGQAYYGGDSLADYFAPNGTVRPPNGFHFLYDYSMDALSASNGAKAPFVIFTTCDSGNFTQNDDSDMEMLLKAPSGGAIGLIASTGRAYRGEDDDDHSFGSWWLNEQLVGRFYEGTTRQGQLLYDIKNEYYTKIYDPSANWTLPAAVMGNIYGFNLLGDPETDIYTSVPQHLTVTYGVAYLNQNSLAIKVKDELGKGVSGATVALWGMGIQARGTTGQDGGVTLNFTAPSLGEMNLTVTKHDTKANVTKVQVIQRPKDLSVASSDIVLSSAESAPGDILTLNITVHNLADVMLGAVQARLEDTYVSGATPKTDVVAELTFDAPAGSDHHLLLTYNSTAPGDHTLTFILDPGNLIAESDEANNKAAVSVHVDAPPLFSGLPKVMLEEDTVLLSALELGDYASDPDNASYELTYGLVFNRDDNCLVSVTPEGIISVIPRAQWSGSTEAVVEVFDGMLSDFTNLTVVVEPVNDPPVISPMLDRVAYVDERFTVFAVSSDPDPGEALIYSDDSALADIDPGSGQFSFIPYTDNIGTYTVTITVTDPTGLSDSTKFNLTIKENDRPRIEQEKFVAHAGTEFKKRIVVKNAPANATYVFSDSTDLFDINPATGEIRFTPKDKDVGTHSVKITARDQHGQVIYGIINIKVSEGSSVNSWALALLIVIVLLALGAVIFYFFVRPNRAQKAMGAGRPKGKAGTSETAVPKGASRNGAREKKGATEKGHTDKTSQRPGQRYPQKGSDRPGAAKPGIGKAVSVKPKNGKTVKPLVNRDKAKQGAKER